jgi:N-acetylmuramoyl-L-alanine amidase
MGIAIGVFVLIGMSTAIAAASFPADATAVQTAKRRSERKPTPTKIPVTPQMISEAQQRLLDLGYWIEEADGKWGEASRHGLIAFQKVERRARTGKLTPDELQALRTATRPLPREHGFVHVEIDLQRQVLFMVDAEGGVSKILPVSTGNGKLFTIEGEIDTAVTPVGRFRVYRKLPGWRKSPLGLLYYPSYIVGGIAIHGNPSVPAQPASHGCIRIPMFAAEEFSNMTPIGTQVIVYDGSVPAVQAVAPPQRPKFLRAISPSSARLSPTGLGLRPQNQPDKAGTWVATP